MGGSSPEMWRVGQGRGHDPPMARGDPGCFRARAMLDCRRWRVRRSRRNSCSAVYRPSMPGVAVRVSRQPALDTESRPQSSSQESHRAGPRRRGRRACRKKIDPGRRISLRQSFNRQQVRNQSPGSALNPFHEVTRRYRYETPLRSFCPTPGRAGLCDDHVGGLWSATRRAAFRRRLRPRRWPAAGRSAHGTWHGPRNGRWPGTRSRPGKAHPRAARSMWCRVRQPGARVPAWERRWNQSLRRSELQHGDPCGTRGLSGRGTTRGGQWLSRVDARPDGLPRSVHRDAAPGARCLPGPRRRMSTRLW